MWVPGQIGVPAFRIATQGKSMGLFLHRQSKGVQVDSQLLSRRRILLLAWYLLCVGMSYVTPKKNENKFVIMQKVAPAGINSK